MVSEIGLWRRKRGRERKRKIFRERKREFLPSMCPRYSLGEGLWSFVNGKGTSYGQAQVMAPPCTRRLRRLTPALEGLLRSHCGLTAGRDGEMEVLVEGMLQ